MSLPSISNQIGDVPMADAVTYAPPAGRPGLRDLWRAKLLEENPSLSGKTFGQPIVTSAITHGLSLAGELFLDPGDVMLMPDKLWGNYRLTFEVRDYRPTAFFAEVSLDVVVDDIARSYHVPLLLAPYGISSYRGS